MSGSPRWQSNWLRRGGVALGLAIAGLLLIFTAVQLYRHRDEDPDVEDNAIVKGARRLLPVSDDYVGGKLLARVDGRRVVTPLFIVLVAIGGIDLLFALDSIPAVFGVTQEAYIVFAANAFALLGLRALFFLVTGLLDRLADPADAGQWARLSAVFSISIRYEAEFWDVTAQADESARFAGSDDPARAQPGP